MVSRGAFRWFLEGTFRSLLEGAFPCLIKGAFMWFIEGVFRWILVKHIRGISRLFLFSNMFQGTYRFCLVGAFKKFF